MCRNPECQRELQRLMQKRKELNESGGGAAEPHPKSYQTRAHYKIIRSYPDEADPGRTVTQRLIDLSDPHLSKESWIWKICSYFCA